MHKVVSQKRAISFISFIFSLPILRIPLFFLKNIPFKKLIITSFLAEKPSVFYEFNK